MCENDVLKCNERIPRKPYKEFFEKVKRFNLPYFTSNEVVVHNKISDCWVSFLGIIRDLTPLLQKHKESAAIRPILAFAGKDISNWFDPRTGDILHHVHPVTGVRVPFNLHGLILDVGPVVPTTEWQPLDHTPWWFDPAYVVGYLTENARPIRIMNVLTGKEHTIEVCSEDTLERILERQIRANSHAHSYTWKYESRVLDMDCTLEENRVPDVRPRLRALHLPDDTYIPCLMLYFNDDLT